MSKQLTPIFERFPAEQSALLPILQAVQAQYSYVHEDAMMAIAKHLNITRAEVYGTASFYHDIRLQPEGRVSVKLCVSEACQAQGSRALEKVAKAAAGANVVIEPTYCLGLCSAGPAGQIGETMYARLDETRMKNLIGAL
jgi:formate dehydrogenase subunit gamma